MIYLTYGDGFSGVYKSQVIDVVKLFRSLSKVNMHLVAFISLRTYRDNRSAIQAEEPEAIVLPMFPGTRRWSWNKFHFRVIARNLGSSMIIARGPLACNLAFFCKTNCDDVKVCYDGRGARAAEIKEYSPDHPLAKEMPEIEKQAVIQSDFRTAVSHKLIQYWSDEYGYHGSDHLMIPCTLSAQFEKEDIASGCKKRKLLGWTDNDVILAFSGSSAGWQQSELLERTLYYLLENDKRVHVLFLSRETPLTVKLQQAYPSRVLRKYVSHQNVPTLLAACDYGLLIRESTITNKVAAPIKFAEYLACGLKVICSEGLGDYSDFVRHNDCGSVLTSAAVEQLNLIPATESQRLSMHELAHRHFSKNSERMNIFQLFRLLQ